MKKLVLAGLLASFAAAPAYAQESTNPAFTGFRVEGVFGFDSLRANEEEDDEDEDVATDNTESGLLYGIGIGYDVATSGGLAGVEAEYTDSRVEQCGDEEDDEDFCVGLGRDLYVGARVGVILSPAMLLYGKIGYTNLRTTLDTNGELDEDEEENFLDEANLTGLDGVRVGGGIEFLLGTNAFVKAEYRYSNYEQGIQRHQGVVGVGFRF